MSAQLRPPRKSAIILPASVPVKSIAERPRDQDAQSRPPPPGNAACHLGTAISGPPFTPAESRHVDVRLRDGVTFETSGT
jgi:hypothetical protein